MTPPHCWRENLTREAAARRGLVPEPMDSPFVPSSLGFDPSRPLDGSTVTPNPSVLPQLAQQARDAQCPDDVLKDMQASPPPAPMDEARRQELLREACDRRVEEFARETSRAVEAIGYKPVEETIVRKLSSLYTPDVMRYGRPPKVVVAEGADKTAISHDGFELVIGGDIYAAATAEKVVGVLDALDFAARMREARDYRRETMRRQLAEAKLLGIPTDRITFATDLETREKLREAAVFGANPMYVTRRMEWTHNCQRCVVASELRAKGLNVIARERIQNGPDDVARHWGLLNSDRYTMSFKRPMAKWDYESEIMAWGEGGRGTVLIDWGNGSSHVFRAEVHHGKIIYYDPQSGKWNVDRYLRQGQVYDVCRTDDVMQTHYIDGAVEARPKEPRLVEQIRGKGRGRK